MLSYYQGRTGQVFTATSAAGGASSGPKKYAPTPPWDTKSGVLRAPDLVKKALGGQRFIDEGAAKLDLAGASADYKKLFALYQGLNTLYGLGERMQTKGVSSTELSRLQSIFSKGVSEITGYVDKMDLEQMRLTRGETMISDKSAVGVPRASYQYRTGTLHTGGQSDAVTAFQGDVVFNISVKRGTATHDIAIDLSEMGSTTRSMGEVASFINQKLQAEGLETRFKVERTPGEPRKITTGGTTVTLPAVAANFAYKITGDSTEQVTFSAPTTKPAVYVTTRAGNPDPDKDIKTDDGKFETSLVKVDGSAIGVEGGRISSGTLEGTIDAVRATKVGPDGSLYILADVNTSIDGQAVKGAKDVALLKYDSTGQLMFARTLGAADRAEGMALAISADGKVAIAGKVTGDLSGATNGPINSGGASTKSDSFVTLFDAAGDEVWTQRRGALAEDEANSVAFGADGTVYVAGRTKSNLPSSNGGFQGGWDGYLTAISTNATTGKPSTLFTEQFGTAGDDRVGGLVVNGSQVVVASVEGNSGILREFNVSGATATAGATRNLGDLQGGDIAGLSLDGGYLWVGGSTRNGALAVAGTTRALAGGMDAFAARISTNLSDGSGDNLAYFGGVGNDTVAAMTVANGSVWLAGTASSDQDGSSSIGEKDGYLASIDVATGVVSSQRLAGKDGYATATSVAVDTSGASALDKMGLPKGTLLYADSVKVASATSVRAGDTFQIRTAEGGRLATVTIEAKDTLDTLAVKIRRAGGYKSKVEVVSDGEFRRLKITPAQHSSTVEVLPGKGGLDALEALGLTPGVIRNTDVDKNGKSVSAAGGGPVFGLQIPGDFDMSSEAGRKTALALLGKSLGFIRDAYRQLETAAKPQAAANKAALGPVPAYLTGQIANYQAALDRLGGG
ncbi:MAG: hypothetical protein Q8L66_11840 [Caulobacter sp.]|nr:hypothetical protein [Caulobacter sp.]